VNAAIVDGFALVDRETAGRCGQLDVELPVGAFDPPDDELPDEARPDDELEDADVLEAVDDAALVAAEPEPDSDDEPDTFSAPLLAPSFGLLPPLLAAPLRESFR